MREAIILAGGFGRRLSKVVPDLPKPMAPVSGKPFLEIILHWLSVNGFSRVILSLGFMADKISGYFGSSFKGLELTYVVEDEPLGTGGAVRLAMTRCTQDHIFVLNGDTFLDFESSLIDSCWHARKNPIIVAREVPDISRYGSLFIADGLVKGFNEKGASGSGLINAGCYVLNHKELDMFPLGIPFSLEADFFTSMVKLIDVDVFITKGQFIDIGIPEDYRRAQTELLNR